MLKADIGVTKMIYAFYSEMGIYNHYLKETYMKKKLATFIIASCFSSVVCAESPVGRGVYSLSGSVSYYENDSEISGKSKRFSAYPGIIYFFYPRIGLGARLRYSYSKNENWDNESYGIEPVIRYYFSGDKFYPFVQLTYGRSKSKSKSGSIKVTGDIETASVSLGFDYFLSRNVSLMPSIVYNQLRVDDSVSSDFENTGLGIGVGINVSIY